MAPPRNLQSFLQFALEPIGSDEAEPRAGTDLRSRVSEDGGMRALYVKGDQITVNGMTWTGLRSSGNRISGSAEPAGGITLPESAVRLAFDILAREPASGQPALDDAGRAALIQGLKLHRFGLHAPPAPLPRREDERRRILDRALHRWREIVGDEIEHVRVRYQDATTESPEPAPAADPSRSMSAEAWQQYEAESERLIDEAIQSAAARIGEQMHDLIGHSVQEVGVLVALSHSLGMPVELPAETETSILQGVWQPVADECVVGLLREVLREAGSRNEPLTINASGLVDLTSRVGTKEFAERISLSTDDMGIALNIAMHVLRTEILTEPRVLVMDGQAFTLHATSDALLVANGVREQSAAQPLEAQERTSSSTDL